MYRKVLDRAGELVAINRIEDGAFIPLAEDNTDYTAYLAWVAEGNTPEEPLPSAPIVQPVSRFQAKAALMNAGLLDQVEALMANPATPALYKLAWAEARDFERESVTVAAMSAALGLSEAQIDDLFAAALQITA